jgi:GAF domain-containing protein
VKGWARQLDALDNIILDIATRLEIPTLLRAIVQRATELLEATGGGIYLLMETGDTFRLEAVYGLPSSLEGHLVNRERGVIGQTIKTRQPLAVAAYREWPNRLQMLDEYNLTSVVAAPILSGERVLGAIAIHDTTQERQFGKEDLDLLLRIANHAAVAIENGKVFAEESQRLEEIQRLYEEQNAIYKASQALVSVLDYDELLDKVLEVLTDQLQYPCCAILLIDEAVNELYIERARNYPAEVQQGTRIKIGGEKGITGQVAATGEPLVVPDVTQEPRYIPGIPNGRSEISVALKMGGKIIGVLDVESTRVNAFNERDQRILTALAAQVAIAIQNAYHHRQIQERQRHLEAVYEASKTILTTVERQEVLDLIVKEAVQRVSGAKGEQALSGSFRAFELDTRSLVLTAAYPAEELSKMRARIGDRIPLDGSRPDGRIGVNGRAAKTRAARLVPDVAKDPDYIAYRPDTRSELVVPVLDGERLLGVLDMEHSRPNAFNESHVKALEALAGLAAIAIKNAEQAERIRHAITLALLGAWGADLAHEINREVGHIRRIIHLLQLRSDLPAEAKDKLQDIDRSADRLRLPSLPGQTPEPDRGEEFENTAVLDQVVKMEVEALVQYWPAITFDSDLQCPGVRVAMHVYWLRRLVRHLVRNATQAIPSTKTLRRVTVRTRVRDDTGEIEVEDTGQGVSPEVHDLFFDSLAPYPDGHQGKGLLLVRFILEQYGGALRLVWSHLGEGACFAISIPIAR